MGVPSGTPNFTERMSDRVADEYKALTHINLPFTEERFAPGEVIPRAAFDESAEQGQSLLGDGATTADETIEHFLEFGSISEDLDAPIHPQNVIPEPGKMTVAEMVGRAKALVEELENAGADVPAKLRDFAAMSEQQVEATEEDRLHIAASDAGQGGGEHSA